MARTVDERTREARDWHRFAVRLDHAAVIAALVTAGIWTVDFFTPDDLIIADVVSGVVTALLFVAMVASYRKSTLIED